MKKNVSTLCSLIVIISSLLIGCSSSDSFNSGLSFSKQTSELFVDVKCDYYDRFDKESRRHFLLKEDRQYGVRISSYEAFTNYVKAIKESKNNGEYISDKVLSYYESIDATVFMKNDMVISGEIHLGDSALDYNFLKMYIKDSSLYLEFRLYSKGAGYEADDNAVHIFYINKDATFTNVVTTPSFPF